MSISLLGERRFLPLFLTQFLGAFNDNFFKNALVVLITFRGVQIAGLPPNMVVALSGGVFIFPYFLFSGTAGQMADKLEKSRLIRYTKILELGVMGLAALGFYLQNFELLLFVLFLMGLQSTLFGPLKYGILPDLVPESELVSANAYVETGTFIAILIGTIAGGLGTLTEHAMAIFSFGVVGVAALGILVSRFIPAVPTRTPDLPLDWTFVRSTWEILRGVAATRPIFNSILAISWFWFLGAVILSVVPAFVKDMLHGNEQVVTAFLAMFTIGIGAGTMLCERLSFKRVEVGVIPFGAIGMSIFLADMYLSGAAWSVPAGVSGPLQLSAFIAAPGAWRLMLDLLLTAICGGVFIVPLYSFIQFRGEPAFRSRIIAANNIVNAVFLVSAALAVMGLYAAGATFPQIFLLTSLVNIAVSIYIYTVVPEFTLRFLGWLVAHVMYRIRVEGREHLPEEGAVVLACNHVSYIDWLIIFSECRRPARFVMDHRIFKIPLVSLLFRHAKVIPIAPAKEDPVAMEAAFAKVSEELREGEVVGIFPEGFLTQDGRMIYFRPGVERIIHQNPVPVVPMALSGLWGSYFSRSRERSLWKGIRGWRRELVLRIGPPVPPDQVTAKHLEDLVRKLWDAPPGLEG